MQGRTNLLRIVGCGLTGGGLLLAGAAVLPLGGALGSVALTSAVPAPLAPSVRVLIVPGPSLAGAATKLTLQLSVIGVAHPTPLVVTDLIPSGLRYVPGSARLATTTRSMPLADPKASVTKRGTLTVWSTVRVVPGVEAESLVLEVAPVAITGKPGTPDLGAAGQSWTDQASVRETRPGRAALVSSHRSTVEVVPVSAVQIGRLVTPARPNMARLQESLTVSSTREGRADDVIVRVYLPGPVTWAGCLPGRWCTRPVVSELRLPVTAAQPDQPRLPPLAGLAPPKAVTRPAVTHLAVNHPAAPTSRFTVLTWRLGTLPAGTSRTLTYRLDASPVAQSRTEDLVTATASLRTVTATTVTPATVTPTTVTPTTVTPTTVTPTTVTPTTVTPATVTPATVTPATVTPATVTPATVTPTTVTPATVTPTTATVQAAATEVAPSTDVASHESADIRASAVQIWPRAAAVATADVNGADATTTTTPIDPFGSASTTTTTAPLGSGSTTTTTTSSSSSSTSTTTTNSTGTTSTTTTTKTSSTTAPNSGLASTGTDVVQTGEAGLGLTGLGGLVLLSSFIRRRRSPAPDDPSGTTPTADR